MNDQRFYALKELRTAAEEACAAAVAEGVRDAANWACLTCLEALQSINDMGEREFRVRIAEASPDAMDLQKFIMVYLHKKGFHGVAVDLEW